MNQRQSPCSQCPFSSSVTPGYLGGSPVDTYIGQIVAGFWLPCHCAQSYRAKESDVNEVEQCAGAAIFRSNIGVAPQMPSGILTLPQSTKAFQSMAHFVAHHTGTTLSEALDYVTPEKIRECMAKELNNPAIRVQLKRR